MCSSSTGRRAGGTSCRGSPCSWPHGHGSSGRAAGTAPASSEGGSTPGGCTAEGWGDPDAAAWGSGLVRGAMAACWRTRLLAVAGTCRSSTSRRAPSRRRASRSALHTGQPPRGAIASRQPASSREAWRQRGIWATRSLPTTNTSGSPGQRRAARSRVSIAQGLLSSCSRLRRGSWSAATRAPSNSARKARGAPWCFWGLSLAQVATRG